jgi:hypothetical protein
VLSRGGDFNADLARLLSHSELLNNFCADTCLQLVLRLPQCLVSYAGNFSLCTFTCLDRVMLSGALFDEAVISVISVSVSHDGDNLSNHDPTF